MLGSPLQIKKLVLCLQKNPFVAKVRLEFGYLSVDILPFLPRSQRFVKGEAQETLCVLSLRTVPTFVTAHTFCASRDTRVSNGWCLPIQGYFCTVQSYAEKAELSKCSWYRKRKLGVTMHFSEMTKLQFGKNAIHCFVFYCFFF